MPQIFCSDLLSSRALARGLQTGSLEGKVCFSGKLSADDRGLLTISDLHRVDSDEITSTVEGRASGATSVSRLSATELPKRKSLG